MKTISKAQWAAIAAAAACLWLHFEFFGLAGPLWRDEAACAALAQRLPWSALWSGTDKDFFPALYYFLLRLWMAFAGGGDLGLRLPGLLIGISSVALLWLHARVFRVGFPVISLALFGLNPLAVRSLDYIRPYGLGILMILAISASLWRLTERPTAGRAAAAALAAVLGLRCFYQSAFFILAFCLSGTALAASRKDRRGAALILAVGAAAALSLIPELRGIAGARIEQLICRSPDNFANAWGAFRNAFGIPWSFCVWLWWLPLLLGAGRALALRRDPRQIYLALALLAAVPLTFLSLKTSGMVVQSHYFAPLMALMAVSLDVFWEAGGAVVPALAAAALLLFFPGALSQLRARQTNVDLIAAKIEAESSPEDMVLVNPWHYGLTFDRYYRGRAPWTTIPPLPIDDDFRIQNYRPVQEAMSKPDILTPVFSRMAKTLKSGNRVWIIGGLGYGPISPILPMPPQGPSGWYVGPYYALWSGQAGYFAQRHARRIMRGEPSPSGTVNRLENAALDVAEGWRD